ncbi:Zinc finger protein 800 [Harpegnathos saltator]|uniref:Zinc finger protein 800 n=1 Tax=Harpegnathos saltator TaxID=610380 RepID=E2BQN0_HARSA|nr:Zinc finger protein 800 [Harpegnathos saltator]
MALEKTKSVQVGTKNKKKNEKFGKVKLPRRDINSTINPDLSNLRKPIDTSVSTLYHISKLLEDATEEVKSILSYECDIIYECRICRSLFRSIANFVSHKREYCKEKFNITLHRNMWDDLNTISAFGSVIHTCQTKETVIKNNLTNDRILRSQVSKETHKRDLTAVVDKLLKKQEENMRNNFYSKSDIENIITPKDQHIYLKAIDTNSSAVYQTIESSQAITNVTDLIAREMTESQSVMDRNSTTLEKSELEKNYNPIQADTNNKDDKMPAYKSSTNSLVCTIFHKLTNEQVRKLRSQIEEIPFDRETAATQCFKKGRPTRTSASEKIKHNSLANNDKEQERISHSESDVKDLSCNGFEEKEVLSAHSQYYQALIAAYSEVKSEINLSDRTSSDLILKDDNYELKNELKDTDATTDTNIKSSTNEDSSNTNSDRTSSPSDIAIYVQDVATLSNEDWDILEHNDNYLSDRNLTNNNNVLPTISPPTVRQNIDDEPPVLEPYISQPSEIVSQDTKEMDFIDLEINHEEGNTLSPNDEKRTIDLNEEDIIEVQQDRSESQPSHSMQSDETELTLSIKNKIAAMTNFQRLQCLLCKRKFISTTSLRRHMANHIKWYRYRCKLCDFKCFFKCDCVAHCNKMHNAQNNPTLIAEMVGEIPQDEYTCKTYENVIMDLMNTRKKLNDLDVVDKVASSSQSEICENLSDSNDANSRAAVHKEETATTKERITDSCESVQDKNVSTEVTGEDTMVCTNLEEYMANRSPGKLDVHPDLKRMVMEVILGSNDANSAAKQADSDKSVSDISNEAGGDTQINDNEISTESIDNTTVTYCSVTSDSKPQRPVRKRIKLLCEDFIYDLGNTQFRKESSKGSSSFHIAGKSPTKQHLNLCDSDTLTNVRKKAKLYNRAVNSN